MFELSWSPAIPGLVESIIFRWHWSWHLHWGIAFKFETSVAFVRRHFQWLALVPRKLPHYLYWSLYVPGGLSCKEAFLLGRRSGALLGSSSFSNAEKDSQSDSGDEKDGNPDPYSSFCGG
jgi:hypothetical protein